MEIDLAQVAARIALGLVVEVGRARISALASCRDRPRPYPIAELDDGDKAVAAGPVPAARAGIGSRAERGERSPAGRDERNRQARRRVRERLDDRAAEPLEAVDLAPGRAPAAELALEPIGSVGRA